MLRKLNLPGSGEKSIHKKCQFLGGATAVHCQATYRTPVRGISADIKKERRHTPLAVLLRESVEVGQVVAGAVTDALETVEGQIVRTRDPCDSSGFHVDEDRLVLLGELAFLLSVGNSVQRDEALAVAIGGCKAFTVRGIDHFADRDGLRRLESAGKRSGPADGDERPHAALAQD